MQLRSRVAPAGGYFAGRSAVSLTPGLKFSVAAAYFTDQAREKQRLKLNGPPGKPVTRIGTPLAFESSVMLCVYRTILRILRKDTWYRTFLLSSCPFVLLRSPPSPPRSGRTPKWRKEGSR